MAMEKKDKIKLLVADMLKFSYDNMIENIDKALSSGAIDIDDWDEKNVPMITPKCIMAALLEKESVQYLGLGTSHEKKIKKEVKNIRYFL